MKKLKVMRGYEKKLNMQLFGLDPDSFAENATATMAQAITIELDYDRLNPAEPNWQVVCLTDYGENPNLQSETKTESCNNGFTSSFLKGFDPEFTFSGLVRKGGQLGKIVKGRYDINLIQDIPMRVTDTLLETQFTAMVTITSMSNASSMADFYSVDITAKPKGAPVMVPLTALNMPDSIVPIEGAGAQGIIDATNVVKTDTSLEGAYTYVANSDDRTQAKIEIALATDPNVPIETITPLSSVANSAWSFTGLTAGQAYIVTMKQGEVILSSQTFVTESALRIKK